MVLCSISANNDGIALVGDFMLDITCSMKRIKNVKRNKNEWINSAIINERNNIRDLYELRRIGNNVFFNNDYKEK